MNTVKNLLKVIVTVAISIIYVGCATDNHTKHFTSLNQFPKSKEVMVRLTTYSKDEKLSKRHRRRDIWTKRGISSTGRPLINMKSIAVDPKLIPYFSTIKLSCLDQPVISIDTGSAVVAKTASIKNGKNFPVIDLFFSKERDAIRFRKKTPLFVWAKIIK